VCTRKKKQRLLGHIDHSADLLGLSPSRNMSDRPIPELARTTKNLEMRPGAPHAVIWSFNFPPVVMLIIEIYPET
jgi:hypothetical protein